MNTVTTEVVVTVAKPWMMPGLWEHDVNVVVPKSILTEAKTQFGWNKEETQKVWCELLRWIRLVVKHPSLGMFSQKVDALWHLCIGTDGSFNPRQKHIAAFPAEYAALCKEAGSPRIFSHYPTPKSEKRAKQGRQADCNGECHGTACDNCSVKWITQAGQSCGDVECISCDTCDSKLTLVRCNDTDCGDGCGDVKIARMLTAGCNGEHCQGNCKNCSSNRCNQSLTSVKKFTFAEFAALYHLEYKERLPAIWWDGSRTPPQNGRHANCNGDVCDTKCGDCRVTIQ